MKKMLFMALAAVTMLSCSKDNKTGDLDEGVDKSAKLTVKFAPATQLGRASIAGADTEIDEGTAFDRVAVAAFRPSGTNDGTEMYHFFKAENGQFLNETDGVAGPYQTELMGYTSAVRDAFAAANLDESVFEGLAAKSSFENKTIEIGTQDQVGAQAKGKLAMTGTASVTSGETVDEVLQCSANISIKRLVSRLDIRINDVTPEGDELNVKGVYLCGTLPTASLGGVYSGDQMKYDEDGKDQWDIFGRFGEIYPMHRNEVEGLATANSEAEVFATEKLSLFSDDAATRYVYNFFPYTTEGVNNTIIVIAATYKQQDGKEAVTYYKVDKFEKDAEPVLFVRNTCYSLEISIQGPGGPTIDVADAQVTATVTALPWSEEDLDGVVLPESQN